MEQADWASCSAFHISAGTWPESPWPELVRQVRRVQRV